ncbi:MAG: hypothetical protein KDA21_05545 [Phycisphaerales bacterium]|nr:hypothetical protein [Phycisphaerales bacterium]
MRHLPLAALALLMALTSAVRAQPGQSLNDLRRENDQLRERVAQLEAQLEAERQASQERVTELTATFRAQMEKLGEQVRVLAEENAALKRGERPGQSTPAPTSSAPKEELPEDPFACPDSLLVTLQAEYDRALSGQERTTDAEQERYMRNVRLWTRQMAGKYRRTVEWEIEVLSVDPVADSDGREMMLNFQVLNPDTGAAWGEPVRVAMSTRYLRRIAETPDQKRWSLRALFGADPQLNAQRGEEGLLNTPPFIGPYAEFVWELKPQSIVESGAMP